MNCCIQSHVVEMATLSPFSTLGYGKSDFTASHAPHRGACEWVSSEKFRLAIADCWDLSRER